MPCQRNGHEAKDRVFIIPVPDIVMQNDQQANEPNDDAFPPTFIHRIYFHPKDFAATNAKQLV
jgi:hypothetical protein